MTDIPAAEPRVATPHPVSKGPRPRRHARKPQPMNRTPSPRLALTALTAALLLVGCQAATVDQPITTEMGGQTADQRLNFWHTLTERSVTSNDEAMHGLLLLLDDTYEAADYDARVALMKRQGYLSESFDEPANQAVTRGTVAVALTRGMEIDGGVMLRVLPHSPRYATRELVYRGIFPSSTPNQTFSGSSFIAVVGKAEDYMRYRDARLARSGAAAADPETQ